MKTRNFLAQFLLPCLSVVAFLDYKNQNGYVVNGVKKRKKKLSYSQFKNQYVKEMETWVRTGRWP